MTRLGQLQILDAVKAFGALLLNNPTAQCHKTFCSRNLCMFLIS